MVDKSENNTKLKKLSLSQLNLKLKMLKKYYRKLSFKKHGVAAIETIERIDEETKLKENEMSYENN